MAISLTSAQRAALKRGELALATLVQLDLPDGTERFWDGDGTLHVHPHNYIGAGSIATITPVGGGMGTDARGLVITLDGARLADAPEVGDPAAVLAQAHDERVHGSRVVLSIAAFDVATEENLFVLPRFAGIIDTMRHVVQPGGVASLEIAVESLSLLLRRPRPRLRSPADQEELYTGDAFFAFTAATVDGTKNVTWGQSK